MNNSLQGKACNSRRAAVGCVLTDRPQKHIVMNSLATLKPLTQNFSEIGAKYDRITAEIKFVNAP
jgi:hypothetical protein